MAQATSKPSMAGTEGNHFSPYSTVMTSVANTYVSPSAVQAMPVSSEVALFSKVPTDSPRWCAWAMYDTEP